MDWNVFGKIGTILFAGIAAIVKWLSDNKDKIQAIVIRIEKDSEDGWTSDEKEQLAVDLFFQEIYPKLPALVKILPKSLIEKWVRSVIKQICQKSHELKDKLVK